MESTTQSHRRPVPHRRRAVWLLAGLVALLLSVGGSSTALAKPSRAGAVGGTLTWALQTNPASLFDAYYFSAEGSTDLLARAGSHPRAGHVRPADDG